MTSDGDFIIGSSPKGISPSDCSLVSTQNPSDRLTVLPFLPLSLVVEIHPPNRMRSEKDCVIGPLQFVIKPDQVRIIKVLGHIEIEGCLGQPPISPHVLKGEINILEITRPILVVNVVDKTSEGVVIRSTIIEGL